MTELTDILNTQNKFTKSSIKREYWPEFNSLIKQGYIEKHCSKNGQKIMFYTVNEYVKQARDFLEKTGTMFAIELIGTDYYFDSDKDMRDIYRINLTNTKHTYTFRYGDSVHNTQARRGELKPMRRMSVYDFEQIKAKAKAEHRPPSAYDVLACLTANEVGTFKDFCDNYGYDEDSRAAFKIYEAVTDEYSNICRLFDESQREELSEIQ